MYCNYKLTKKLKHKSSPVSTCLVEPLQVDNRSQYRLHALVYKVPAYQILPTENKSNEAFSSIHTQHKQQRSISQYNQH